jgi:hypothetical protein
MVTTAGITRAIRSSSAAGVSAGDGTASGSVAVRRSGTGSAGGVGHGGAGAGAGCTAVEGTKSGAVVDAADAGFRLPVHQTVAAIATAATATSVLIWTRMDPADVRRSVITVFRGFRLRT